MRNVKTLMALLPVALLLAGCAQNGKVSVTQEQLLHHRFVLESVNGKALASQDKPLELSFGEGMYVYGNMCNSFNGEGTLSQGTLTVKSLAMTRMMCRDTQLNQLDSTLSTMLRDGAQVDLTGNQLTLATAKDSLVYKLADLMH